MIDTQKNNHSIDWMSLNITIARWYKILILIQLSNFTLNIFRFYHFKSLIAEVLIYYFCLRSNCLYLFLTITLVDNPIDCLTHSDWRAWCISQESKLWMVHSFDVQKLWVIFWYKEDHYMSLLVDSYNSKYICIRFHTRIVLSMEFYNTYIPISALTCYITIISLLICYITIISPLICYITISPLISYITIVSKHVSMHLWNLM